MMRHTPRANSKKIVAGQGIIVISFSIELSLGQMIHPKILQLSISVQDKEILNHNNKCYNRAV